RIYENGNFSDRSRGDDWPPCTPGPVRVVASVSGGDILRLRTYAGPRRAGDSPPRDLGIVPVSEATDFLARLIEQAHGRAANDAVLPFVLADSITPWPTLLRFARDEQLSRGLRSNVAFWLARGATAKLGLADRNEDDDDDVRSSAVFALSQQPKETAIPELIEVVRHAPHPAARAQALFWLGQSGDRRAIDLLDEILRRR
ncbi:MAG TPA: HEAT repeat domain-containing protein, partial [Gemmatimonadaceae bacterium]|nr:HEAT repeat domain-containing protein [Gemmatimonadaceae bacterium]